LCIFGIDCNLPPPAMTIAANEKYEERHV
jgi:hypothetical protein